MRRCYIITKQVFYEAHGEHHQCADDNPVVEVFTSEAAAKHFVDRIVLHHVAFSPKDLHFHSLCPNSELIYKAGAFDSSERCDLAYSVIKKGMLQ